MIFQRRSPRSGAARTAAIASRKDARNDLRNCDDFAIVDGRSMVLSEAQKRALRGLDVDAIGEYDPRLQCAICCLPAFEGVMTKACGHHFHRECLDNALKRTSCCPMCRTNLGGNGRENGYLNLKDNHGARFLRESINQLKVQCPMGCGAEVAFETLKGHVHDSCMATQFRCKHSPACPRVDCRDVIVTHEEVCEEAAVSCACKKVLKRKEVHRHQERDCPMHPISCTYCSQQGILRGEMENHLDNCNGTVTMHEYRSNMRSVSYQMSRLTARLNSLEREVNTLRSAQATEKVNPLCSPLGSYRSTQLMPLPDFEIS